MGFSGNYTLALVCVFLLSEFHVLNAKECTNTPTQLSSKTLRFEVLSSKNETWKREIMSHMHAHYHLTPTEEVAWSSLFPRKMLREDEEMNWNVLYKKIKYSNKFKLEQNFLKEISLHDVRLDPKSLQGRGQQTNLEYLLILDLDSLVWSFRRTAGLPTPGSPYGGWEGPDVELRGHFVGWFFSSVLCFIVSIFKLVCLLCVGV